MNLPLPELAQCAAEPIRVPGAIQPHGRMVVLSAGGQLLAHSANWPDAAGALAATAGLAGRLQAMQPGEAPAPLGSVQAGGHLFEATGHRTASLLVAEFEPSEAASGDELPIYWLARHGLPRLQRASSLHGLAEVAAALMKELTGFGRCLVYRFDGNGDGEVLGERIDAGYDSYAWHYFPAGDIPQQARDLYLLNQIRLIPDADYSPVPLLCADPALDARSLDLSQAALRSVSPVHLEYMRNMRTLSSMSVSIVVKGRLWGLISCHDHAPRQLSFAQRVACEHLGRLLSLQIEAKEDNEDVATRLELRRLTLQIVASLAESDATLHQLVEDPVPLLRLARAGGAAVVLDGACWTAGETPTPDRILALAQLVAASGQEIFHSDRLGEAHPGTAADAMQASGLLAISISQVHRHQILWFRPEIVQTIQWAGEPHKQVQSQDGRIHPRRSFASWKEQVRGRSSPWGGGEVAAALELRQALIGIVLRRAEEMAEVAAELGRVNKELEAFSYTVSHDLRAPMRHIAGYVDLVLDSDGRLLGERALRYLGQVKEAAAFAGQLVDALLDFSRMGRAALKRNTIDTEGLVGDLVRELERQEPGRAIAWQIDTPLPALQADPFLLQVVLRNLLGNAAKYTRRQEAPRIHVAAVRTADGEGLEISDNGVGFQMQYVGKLFGVFQRLHQAEEFEGTGIGLATVKRIVERHGGNVWARGEPGQGASFGFTLPAGNTDALPVPQHLQQQEAS